MTDSDSLQNLEVVHNQAAQQFELHVRELVCLLQYRRADDRMIIYHTEVPPSIQGRGLAARMTHTALQFAQAEGLRVVPRCPYTAAFLGKHREYAGLLG